MSGNVNNSGSIYITDASSRLLMSGILLTNNGLVSCGLDCLVEFSDGNIRNEDTFEIEQGGLFSISGSSLTSDLSADFNLGDDATLELINSSVESSGLVVNGGKVILREVLITDSVLTGTTTYEIEDKLGVTGDDTILSNVTLESALVFSEAFSSSELRIRDGLILNHPLTLHNSEVLAFTGVSQVLSGSSPLLLNGGQISLGSPLVISEDFNLIAGGPLDTRSIISVGEGFNNLGKIELLNDGAHLLFLGNASLLEPNTIENSGLIKVGVGSRLEFRDLAIESSGIIEAGSSSSIEVGSNKFSITEGVLNLQHGGNIISNGQLFISESRIKAMISNVSPSIVSESLEIINTQLEVFLSPLFFGEIGAQVALMKTNTLKEMSIIGLYSGSIINVSGYEFEVSFEGGLKLILTTVPEDYHDWIKKMIQSTDSEDLAMFADFDSDGLSNYLEYRLNLDPSDYKSTLGYEWRSSNGEVDKLVVSPFEPSDVIDVESSTDLNNWQSIENFGDLILNGSLILPLSTDPAGSTFYRVKAKIEQ